MRESKYSWIAKDEESLSMGANLPARVYNPDHVYEESITQELGDGYHVIDTNRQKNIKEYKKYVKRMNKLSDKKI